MQFCMQLMDTRRHGMHMVVRRCEKDGSGQESPDQAVLNSCVGVCVQPWLDLACHASVLYVDSCVGNC